MSLIFDGTSFVVTYLAGSSLRRAFVAASRDLTLYVTVHSEVGADRRG